MKCIQLDMDFASTTANDNDSIDHDIFEFEDQEREEIE